MEEKEYKFVKAVVYEGQGKNGRPYRFIRVKVGDYVINEPVIWINGPLAYLFKKEQGK